MKIFEVWKHFYCNKYKISAYYEYFHTRDTFGSHKCRYTDFVNVQIRVFTYETQVALKSHNTGSV